MPVAEALSRVLANALPLGPEQVAIAHAHGRTLAHDLAAALTNPPFDCILHGRLRGARRRHRENSGNA